MFASAYELCVVVVEVEVGVAEAVGEGGLDCDVVGEVVWAALGLGVSAFVFVSSEVDGDEAGVLGEEGEGLVGVEGDVSV